MNNQLIERIGAILERHPEWEIVIKPQSGKIAVVVFNAMAFGDYLGVEREIDLIHFRMGNNFVVLEALRNMEAELHAAEIIHHPLENEDDECTES